MNYIVSQEQMSPSITSNRKSITEESIGEHLPMEFARKQRTVKDLKRWKATEFRQFLLYTGTFVQRKIVSEDVYVHFLCFNFAMRCSNFKNVYGKKSVSFYGCLERISAFKFEDELQRLKRLVRKKDKPLQQIIRRQAEMGLKATRAPFRELIKRNVGTLPLGLLEPGYLRITVKNVKVSMMRPYNYVFLRIGTMPGLTRSYFDW
ncbi:hypothetical protein J437_LFUL016028 [Ladona fulva]|uniref:Uncharacterized protein n=1 Tax=Ladona fulva TaxID=123851 RepID=A0A8K0P6I6_LADFU|nr:hypothetical protein J437_LFUL016028 [Ladona fulva]